MADGEAIPKGLVYRDQIIMGENWQAIESILGLSESEFAEQMAEESALGCDQDACNIKVNVQEVDYEEFAELVVACSGCVGACFRERVADITESIDDIALNHSLASYARREQGTQEAYDQAVTALPKPKMPLEFATLRRQNRANRPRATHVVRPDIESDSHRGRKVKNVDPKHISKFL